MVETLVSRMIARTLGTYVIQVQAGTLSEVEPLAIALLHHLDIRGHKPSIVPIPVNVQHGLPLDTEYSVREGLLEFGHSCTSCSRAILPRQNALRQTLIESPLALLSRSK